MAERRDLARAGCARRRGARLAPAGLAVGLLAAAALTGCTDDGDDGAPSTTEPPAATSTATTDDGSVTPADVDTALGQLDGIVEAAMDETGIPGVSVAVVHDDEVLTVRGYGVRSTETGEPVEPETIFQIASLSKPVSSTIMAGVVGDGTIEWDEPVAPHVPDLALSDAWVTEHVTFADLFAHRSGLPGAVAGNDLEAVGFERPEILARLRDVPLDPFRITYSYSNFGMTLGGEAAARAAGTSWEDLADQVLFEPAGMTSTSMRHEDFVAAEGTAAIHVRTEDGWAPAFERQPDAQAPAGGVSSNAVDLGTWLRLQLAEGSLDGEQLIDADALDATHTPQVMTRPGPTIADPAAFYGLGWNIEVDAEGRVVWNHSGAFSTGTSTAVRALPADGLGIVVLTNGEPIGVPEAIAESFLDVAVHGAVTTDFLDEVWAPRFAGLYGDPIVDVDDPPADPAPAREASAYVGTYANDYVGEVEVVADGDALALVLGPQGWTYDLEHWDGDVFLYRDAPELPDHPATATFTVAADGTASALVLSSFDGAGLGTVERVG